MSRAQTRSIGIAVLAGALAAGAAAFAAAHSAGEDAVAVPEAAVAPLAPTTVEIAPVPDPAPAAMAASAAPARHPRFFDTYYVFVSAEPARVEAYPLASPPGIVVDLVGVPEPGEPAAELVGEDDRIRSIRRRVTERGLRYVIGIATPVQRLEVEHEGGVVIIAPVR